MSATTPKTSQLVAHREHMFKHAGDIISVEPPVLAASEAVWFVKDIGSAKWPWSGTLVGAQYDAEIQRLGTAIFIQTNQQSENWESLGEGERLALWARHGSLAYNGLSLDWLEEPSNCQHQWLHKVAPWDPVLVPQKALPRRHGISWVQ